MLPLERAQSTILVHTPLADLKKLPLSKLYGLCLSQDIQSPHPLPPFNNSAMDGYAIHLPTHWENPLKCKVLDHIPAGKVSSAHLNIGEAVKIMTGAPVPLSANTVVPIENITSLSPTEIQIDIPPTLNKHIRWAGEEVKAKETILAKGHILHAGSIGLLASLGITEAPVYYPKVGILATGSELLSIESSLEPGKIRDSNTPALSSLIQSMGLNPVCFGIAPDNKEALAHTLKQALEKVDVLLTSGGVSVGDYDYVQELLLDMGFKKAFWKVAIKPGKPVLFGTFKNKLVFGIPGNPGSALTVFEYLIRPALRKMMGYSYLWRPQTQGILTSDVKPAKNRLHLMRVNLSKEHDGSVLVSPLKAQGSSNLLTMSLADAILPVYKDYKAGDPVTVDCPFLPEDH